MDVAAADCGDGGENKVVAEEVMEIGVVKVKGEEIVVGYAKGGWRYEEGGYFVFKPLDGEVSRLMSKKDAEERLEGYGGKWADVRLRGVREVLVELNE